MKINDFKLEVFFGKHEFSAPYLLAQSDCQSMTINDLLDLEAGAKEKFLNSSLAYTQVKGSQALIHEIAKLYDQDIPYFRMGYGRMDFPENLRQLETYLLRKDVFGM